MGILSFFRKSKADQSDKLYYQGIRFKSAKNKHLRLYFESQFTPDIEEDDLNYLTHIFEQKTYLLFGFHYSIINLMNTDNFLKETYDKLVDTNYRELKNINITHKFLDNQEMTTHIFNYKIVTNLEFEYKICRVNFWAQKSPEIGEEINISPKVMENIKTTDEIQIYNFLSDNTNLVYFVLKLVFEQFSKSVHKLVVYQIGMKTIDEPIFTFLASYIRNNKKIDSFCLYGRTLGQFRHLKPLLEDQKDDKDEKMENEIHNVQHIFNLYQVLIKKENLIELRLILFLTHYNFTMLSMVLYNNQKLRFLEIRNIITRDMEPELDYSFKEMNEYGDNIKDEIFIFFNYLYNLEFLEELQLTHFTFFSEINFMAVQVAKTMKNIKIFSVEKNQGLINNDDVMANSYDLGKLELVSLNMGMTYYHSIRNWDSMINQNTLTFMDVGVVDFISFCGFVRFLESTILEKAIIKLNRPVLIESIPLFFDIISGSPMRTKSLKYFYVLNPFDASVKDSLNNKNKGLVIKLYNVLKNNNTMRRLGFAKPAGLFYEVRNEDDFQTFKYIRKRDYDSVIYLIKSMQRIFKNYKGEGVKKILHLIIEYRFTTFRKLIIG